MNPKLLLILTLLFTQISTTKETDNKDLENKSTEHPKVTQATSADVQQHQNDTVNETQLQVPDKQIEELKSQLAPPNDLGLDLDENREDAEKRLQIVDKQNIDNNWYFGPIREDQVALSKSQLNPAYNTKLLIDQPLYSQQMYKSMASPNKLKVNEPIQVPYRIKTDEFKLPIDAKPNQGMLAIEPENENNVDKEKRAIEDSLVPYKPNETEDSLVPYGDIKNEQQHDEQPQIKFLPELKKYLDDQNVLKKDLPQNMPQTIPRTIHVPHDNNTQQIETRNVNVFDSLAELPDNNFSFEPNISLQLPVSVKDSTTNVLPLKAEDQSWNIDAQSQDSDSEAGLTPEEREFERMRREESKFIVGNDIREHSDKGVMSPKGLKNSKSSDQLLTVLSDEDYQPEPISSDQILAYIMNGLLVVTGLYVALFGIRVFRLLMIILGFYVSYYILLFMLTELDLYNSHSLLHQLCLFFSCVALGFIIAIACYMMERVNFFIFGTSIGIIIALFYAQFFINFDNPENKKRLLIVITAASATFSVMAFFILDKAIIFGSAAVGAAIAAINFGVILNDFKSFENRETLPPDSWHDFKKYIIGATVLFIVGVGSQFYLRKRIINRFEKGIEVMSDVSYIE